MRKVLVIGRACGSDEDSMWTFDVLAGETDDAASDRAIELAAEEALGERYLPHEERTAKDECATSFYVNQVICADGLNVVHSNT